MDDTRIVAAILAAAETIILSQHLPAPQAPAVVRKSLVANYRAMEELLTPAPPEPLIGKA